jgi:Ca2+-binding EF-hand superfamily protein
MENLLFGVFTAMLSGDDAAGLVSRLAGVSESSISAADVSVAAQLLATSSTRTAFQEADTNSDGSISRDEFFRWINSSSQVSNVVLQSAGVPSGSDLRQFFNVIAWDTVSVDQLLSLVGNQRLLTLSQTRSLVDQLPTLPQGVMSSQDIDTRVASSILFSLCQQAEQAWAPVQDPERIHARTLIVSLAPFAGATPLNIKAEQLFAVYDADGTMHCTFEKLWKAFLCVLSVRLAVQPKLLEWFSGWIPSARDALDIAAWLAGLCMRDCRASEVGYLTFKDFQKLCYEHPLMDLLLGTRAATAPVSLAGGPAPDEAVPFSVDQIFHATSLASASAADVIRKLQAVAVSGTVSIGGVKTQSRCIRRGQFLLALQEFIKFDTNELEVQSEIMAASSTLSELFDIYLVRRSKNGDASDDIADANALSVGLSLICSVESPLERASLSFSLFDTDRSGDISFAEALTYITAVVALQSRATPAVRLKSSMVHQVAMATARELFQAADTDADGKLSRAEFFQFFLPNALESLTLQQLREITSIHLVDPALVVEIFAQHAGDAGYLSESGFLAGVEGLRFEAGVSALTQDEQEALRLVFQLFELPNDAGVADFVDIMAALLCIGGGTRTRKMDIITACFDPDDTGTLESDDVYAFFSALFTLLAGLHAPQLSQFGVVSDVESGKADLAELAELLTQEVIETCGTASGVDRQAFCSWYISNFSEVGNEVAENHADTFEWCSTEEAARLLRLQDTPVQKLLELFSAVANDDGSLTEDAFDAVFASLALEAEHDAVSEGHEANSVAFSPLDRHRAAALRHALFSAFEANADGTIEAPEIVAGLTILASGSRQHKIRAAFAALDVDDNGKRTYTIIYLCIPPY